MITEPQGSRSLDEELMKRFSEGDEAAFDLLFARHALPVHRFIHGIVRDAELTRDLVQLTFLSLVRSRLRYQHGTAVAPWLLTIAGNAARDALRHEKQVSAYLELERAAAPRAAAPTDSDPGLRRQLLLALEVLSGGQRDAVVQHKLHGWSFDEIARAAGISEEAARLRAHRGYLSLRASLLTSSPAR